MPTRSLRLSRMGGSVGESATLRQAARVAALRAAGRTVYNFTVGEPDCETPAAIRDAAHRAIDTGHTRYTATAGTAELRAAVARYLLGGTFDFKFLKLRGGWADQSAISTAISLSGVGSGLPSAMVPAGIAYYDNSAWMLGVTVPLFGGNLRGSYQYSDAKNIISGLAQYEPDYSVWGLGYDFPFSRRTNVYVGYAQREWDGRVTQANGTALPQASPIFDRKQFAVGLRHLF